MEAYNQDHVLESRKRVEELLKERAAIDTMLKVIMADLKSDLKHLFSTPKKTKRKKEQTS